MDPLSNGPWIPARTAPITKSAPVGWDATNTSVVDPQLRVRGVEKLRVADASVMPTIIRGHTHAPSVMIGEKLADLIGN